MLRDAPDMIEIMDLRHRRQKQVRVGLQGARKPGGPGLLRTDANEEVIYRDAAHGCRRTSPAKPTIIHALSASALRCNTPNGLSAEFDHERPGFRAHLSRITTQSPCASRRTVPSVRRRAALRATPPCPRLPER